MYDTKETKNIISKAVPEENKNWCDIVRQTVPETASGLEYGMYTYCYASSSWNE